MSTAFIFPGQGSQSVGMMDTLATSNEVVRQTFEEAGAALGYDLWKLVTEGPVEKLNSTEHTQPAMLVAGVASWRAYRQAGGQNPALMAGHSLGEYTALVCAGAIEFDEAVSLVADRARFMQEAVPEGDGAMAAILGLDDETVMSLCAESAAGEVIEAVNFNAPGQVVVAGTAAAVNRMAENARTAGAKRALVLPVSVPSHCALMKPASDRMAERLKRATIMAPEIPVIHNVNVETTTVVNTIRDLLARQISEPVRWVETIKRMENEGVTHLVECGPGKVLCGLSKRINRDIGCIPLISKDSITAAMEL
jgi:[acyl-carrier-protein] S-malonyltransferase